MTVWDSAIVLGHYFAMSIQRGEINLTGKSVLEIGSGTGALGLMLAFLGAHVVLTDIDECEQMQLLRSNVSRNISKNTSGGTANVMPLTWGQPNIKPVLSAFDLRAGVLDHVDYVVASDVIYDENIVSSLLHTFAQVTSTRTAVFLSYESHKLGPLKKFFGEARELFEFDHIPFSELHDTFRCGGICVKRMTRKTNILKAPYVPPSTSTSLEDPSFATNDDVTLWKMLTTLQKERSDLLNRVSDIDAITSRLTHILFSRSSCCDDMRNKEMAHDEQCNQGVQHQKVPLVRTRIDLTHFLSQHLLQRPNMQELVDKCIIKFQNE